MGSYIAHISIQKHAQGAYKFLPLVNGILSLSIQFHFNSLGSIQPVVLTYVMYHSG